MAQSLLILFIFTLPAQADLFDFGSDKGRESKISVMVEKLKSLELKEGPEYEDRFNQMVKAIENAVEEEKLFCAGEVADAKGKTVPASQKQVCMRDLKKNYVEATETIFEMKKKYLAVIHQRQIQKLSEIQKKLKADIEKNF